MSDRALKKSSQRILVTRMVHDWFQMRGGTDPALAPAMEIIRSGGNLADSGERLESWLLEKLIVDPGLAVSFADLAHDLLGTMLDVVDWQLVVKILRERDKSAECDRSSLHTEVAFSDSG
jgi:hypothetical protein